MLNCYRLCFRVKRIETGDEQAAQHHSSSSMLALGPACTCLGALFEASTVQCTLHILQVLSATVATDVIGWKSEMLLDP